MKGAIDGYLDVCFGFLFVKFVRLSCIWEVFGGGVVEGFGNFIL